VVEIAGNPGGGAGTGPTIENVVAGCRHRNSLRIWILPAPINGSCRRTAGIRLIANKIGANGTEPDLSVHASKYRSCLYRIVWHAPVPKSFGQSGQGVWDWLEPVIKGHSCDIGRRPPALTGRGLVQRSQRAPTKMLINRAKRAHNGVYRQETTWIEISETVTGQAATELPGRRGRDLLFCIRCRPCRY
jgi:hypothetical protein